MVEDPRKVLLEQMFDAISAYLLDECPDGESWKQFDPQIDHLRDGVGDMLGARKLVSQTETRRATVRHRDYPDVRRIASDDECEEETGPVARSATKPAFDKQTLGTLLAGLHLFRSQGCPAEFEDMASNGGLYEFMSDGAIDDLCERPILGDENPPEAGRLLVVLDKGRVSSVVADRPVELITIDYDAPDTTDDQMASIPQGDGHGRTPNSRVGPPTTSGSILSSSIARNAPSAAAAQPKPARDPP